MLWTFLKVFNIPIKWHWSYVLLCVFIVFMSGVLPGLLAASALTFFLLAHELGHALVAQRKYKRKIDDIVFMGFGAATRMHVGGLPSKNEEIIVCLAGPLVNIVFALVCAPFLLFPATYFYALVAVYMNAVLGIFNLIPIFPMDGGRILRGILRNKFDFISATKYCAIIGNILVLLSLPYLIVTGEILMLALVVLVGVYAWVEYFQVLEFKEHFLDMDSRLR